MPSSKSEEYGSTWVRPQSRPRWAVADGVESIVGPLLWHFENTEGVSSIELTLEDVKLAATKLGFKISNEAEIQTSYISNPHSMLSSHYTASFFVCTKV